MFGTIQLLLGNAVLARQQASRYHALELEGLAEYAMSTQGDEFAHLEVAALLHISDRAAQARLAFAVTLVGKLQPTLLALKDGYREEFKAQFIAEAVAPLSLEQAALVEEHVLPDAPEQTPTQLRRALARAVMAVDPEGAEQRRQAKVRGRRVSCQPTEDGEAVLSIVDRADRITAMYGVITSYAHHLKSLGNEPRTIAQLEADIACELLLGNECELRQIEVHLTIPSSGLAELEGVGPITREAATELAAEAKSWRWLKTDPLTGEVRDVTTRSYKPPKALRDLVKIRDRTCRFPGCMRLARRCDTDHQIPWPEGPTNDTNCYALCRRHHRAKHDGGWQIEHIRPGHLKWTSPLGFKHHVTPEAVDDPPPF